MIKKIILFIIFSLIASGCSVYHPHMVDIPLINKKKDVRFDAGVSTVLLFHGTFSYGITKNIAIQTFGSFGESQKYYVHQAIGYFNNLGNNKVMEVYAGYGYGYGDAYNDANPGALSGNYSLYFTQFNFGKIDCKSSHTDIGFGIRTGFMHSNFTDTGFYERYYPPASYPLTDDSFILEPNAFLRFGGEKFKLSLKLGTCLIYKFTNKDKSLPYNMINLGLGFNYSF
jgi:hypothetical protein